MTIRELYMKFANIKPDDEVIIKNKNDQTIFKGTFSSINMDDFQDEDIKSFAMSYHLIIKIYAEGDI